MTDESNSDTGYDRNFLRLEILPLLTARWSGFRESLKRTSEICAESSELLDEVADDDLSAAVNPATGGLIISRLGELSLVRRRNTLRRFYFLKGSVPPSYNFLISVFDEVAEAGSDGVPELRWEGGIAVRFRGELFNIREYPEVPGTSRLRRVSGKQFSFQTARSQSLILRTMFLRMLSRRGRRIRARK